MVRRKRGGACIVGLGEESMTEGNALNYWSMAALAAKRAIESAGITNNDIDGLVVSTSSYTLINTQARVFVEYLGFKHIRHAVSVPYLGGLQIQAFEEAMLMVAAGLAENVLILACDNMAFKYTRRESIQNHAYFLSEPQWERPYGMTVPGSYALAAQRYMHEYNATSEQFATVKVAATKWAQMSPFALQKQPITIEDVLNSPIIYSPLHLYDFSLFGGAGAYAFVMMPPGKAIAKGRELGKPPVSLEAIETRPDRHTYTAWVPDLTTGEELVAMSSRAFATAGVTRKDMDIVYCCDTTTHQLIQLLEDIGFCKKGEGCHFVADGRIEPGGEFPVNTSGGSLSGRHPGGAVLLYQQAAELVTQLRGEAGQRQVQGAELAFLMFPPSTTSHMVCIWRRL